jgi:hypothetical protein
MYASDINTISNRHLLQNETSYGEKCGGFIKYNAGGFLMTLSITFPPSINEDIFSNTVLVKPNMIVPQTIQVEECSDSLDGLMTVEQYNELAELADIVFNKILSDGIIKS